MHAKALSSRSTSSHEIFAHNGLIYIFSVLFIPLLDRAWAGKWSKCKGKWVMDLGTKEKERLGNSSEDMV